MGYKLVHVGRDGFQRELYYDKEEKIYFCDTAFKKPYSKEAVICTKGFQKEGEPIFEIKNYTFVEPKKKKRIRGFETVRTEADAKLPVRATNRSAGYDFFSITAGIVPPGERRWFKTGIKAYMRKDEVLLCVPRSSLGFKHGIRLSNGTGVIDSDYYNNPDNEGEIQVSLHNTSDKEFAFPPGERLFQGIFVKYLIADDDKPLVKKRNGGIGSSGK